jgi:putative transposase
MMDNTTKPDSLQPAAEKAVDLFDNWFDPIETEVRVRAREFIEELLRDELDTALARPRYGRSQMAGKEARAGVAGHRHGSRTRSLTGTFGPIEIAVPRARLTTSEGGTTEWKSTRCGPISGARLPPTRRSRAPISPAPIQGGCVARWRRCSARQSARTP